MHFDNGMNGSQMPIDNHVYFSIDKCVSDLVCRTVFVSNTMKYYTCHSWPMNILYSAELNFEFYELGNFLDLAVYMANTRYSLAGCNFSNDEECDAMAYRMAPNNSLCTFDFVECDWPPHAWFCIFFLCICLYFCRHHLIDSFRVFHMRMHGKATTATVDTVSVSSVRFRAVISVLNYWTFQLHVECVDGVVDAFTWVMRETKNSSLGKWIHIFFKKKRGNCANCKIIHTSCSARWSRCSCRFMRLSSSPRRSLSTLFTHNW